MTLNSALSQNWVVCTMRTPRTPVGRTPRTIVHYRSALGAVSLHAERSVATHATPCRDTTIAEPGHALAAARPCVQARPCHARCCAVSCVRCDAPQHASQAVSHLGAHLRPTCLDITCCVTTRTGKWAVSHPSFSPATFFFFHLFYPL